MKTNERTVIRTVLTRQAAWLWAGEEPPTCDTNEYMRGQVELIVASTTGPYDDPDVVRDEVEFELRKLVIEDNERRARR